MRQHLLNKAFKASVRHRSLKPAVQRLSTTVFLESSERQLLEPSPSGGKNGYRHPPATARGSGAGNSDVILGAQRSASAGAPHAGASQALRRACHKIWQLRRPTRRTRVVSTTAETSETEGWRTSRVTEERGPSSSAGEC